MAGSSQRSPPNGCVGCIGFHNNFAPTAIILDCSMCWKVLDDQAGDEVTTGLEARTFCHAF
jgi:hypothetical protein